MELIHRYRGSFLGLAVGDAVGTTLEFKAPGSFSPIEDMVGGGTFGLKPGYWTDDTSMALCLAHSLIDQQGFDPVDQLQQYLRWSREGQVIRNPSTENSASKRAQMKVASEFSRLERNIATGVDNCLARVY
ncbi:ADP-ribosylglycohydrolase family protein [Moorena sp. SIO3H5]|uniref:ADP-ribosylglycohydrolase family protein n=1 Tax=Moorena sp. SIO3H5 TaxID=2607834 RepID=UPI0025F5C962|nr:ADP-ribosylglycohydrolase family protein [Moorena sp. SIO3H5]